MDPEIQLVIIGYIRFSKVGKTKFLGAMIEELGRRGILSTDIMKKIMVLRTLLKRDEKKRHLRYLKEECAMFGLDYPTSRKSDETLLAYMKKCCGTCSEKGRSSRGIQTSGW